MATWSSRAQHRRMERSRHLDERVSAPGHPGGATWEFEKWASPQGLRSQEKKVSIPIRPAINVAMSVAAVEALIDPYPAPKMLRGKLPSTQRALLPAVEGRRSRTGIGIERLNGAATYASE